MTSLQCIPLVLDHKVMQQLQFISAVNKYVCSTGVYLLTCSASLQHLVSGLLEMVPLPPAITPKEPKRHTGGMLEVMPLTRPSHLFYQALL